MPRKKEDNKQKQDNKKSAKKNNNKTSSKKKSKKLETKDEIEVSKQLLIKKSLAQKASRSKSKVNSVRTYENAKPMPHLADLEKLFDDSDDENTHPIASCETPPKQINQHSELPFDKNKLSPNTIHPLKDKVVCENRPQVEWKPKTKFGISDNYGVNTNTHNEDETCRKRAKKSNIPNITKSIFNAKSDVIAKMLKDSSENLSDSSETRTDTIPYFYDKDCDQNSRPLSFSPVPCTSKDIETIIKNDEMMNNSYIFNNQNYSISSLDIVDPTTRELSTKDVEVVEAPIETIVIDSYNENETNEAIIDIDNNSVQIIDSPMNRPIVIDDDDYSAYPYINNTSHSDIEVIDVDEIIEEKTVTCPVTTVHKSDNLTSLNETDRDIEIGDIASGEYMQIINRNTTSNVATEQIILIDESHCEIHTTNNRLEETSSNSNLNTNILHNAPEVNNLTPLFHSESVASSPCIVRSKQRTNKHTPKNIQTAKNTLIQTPLGNGILYSCPICMDNMKGKVIASTLCGHVFCMECIKKSVKIMGKKCPTCRKTFRGVGYIQIFL